MSIADRIYTLQDGQMCVDDLIKINELIIQPECSNGEGSMVNTLFLFSLKTSP